MSLPALALLLVFSVAAPLGAQTDYPLTPDSERQPGVPAGEVTAHRFESTIFPGTVRDYWVYVPAQYRADRPAALMVFQDGGSFVREDGRWRVPIVLDNLIAREEMPVTIGVFIDPGVLPSASGEAPIRYDRSFEYDALGDRYVALPPRGDPARGRPGPQPHLRPQPPGHRRLVLRRHLRVHRGLEPAGRVPACPLLHRLLHEPPRRAGLSLPSSGRPSRSPSASSSRTAATT